MDRRKALGERGERRALEYLQQCGYTLIVRNFRTRNGEIDLIVAQENILAFVEVKTRRSSQFGAPMEAVDARKQGKIILVAQQFMQQYPMYTQHQMRFDVIECTDRIHHLPDAFRP